MNCFHFSVSLGYKTTSASASSGSSVLWIAFIFQYLWDTKQLWTFTSQPSTSCELLSFFSIFGIQNNSAIFVHLYSPLWIAFIFQYLWDTKQLFGFFPHFCYCCELLSFFSIFGIQNNFKVSPISLSLVVNCFHFSVSLGYKTTIVKGFNSYYMLWIAFIFQYLWDTKQLAYPPQSNSKCCELLSFFSIFGIQNNYFVFIQIFLNVVNCFHFSVSLGYKTTVEVKFVPLILLWIAFIFQYLWDTKQPPYSCGRTFDGCELLSFFSIFGIQNNI